MAKVAVILSGCGVYDGAEIHEATLTLLHLARAGAEVVCAAPDIAQANVIDHRTGKPVHLGTRNALVESARIARGAIVPLDDLNPGDVDAAVLPGGFGAAQTLSDFAEAGAACAVNPVVQRFLDALFDAGKPVAALCIAPPLVARVLQQRGTDGVQMTIGDDPATAKAIQAMHQKHVACAADDCVVDRDHKLVTTPAYMLAKDIATLSVGIEKAVTTLLSLV